MVAGGLRRVGVVFAVLVVSVAGATTANAAGPRSGGDGDSGTHGAVRHGTTLSSHGVKRVCADAGLACLVQAVTQAPGSKQLLSTSNPVGYGAGELADAYGLKPGAGQAGTIAIIDAGADPKLESDVAAYRRQYGLPPCTAEGGCFSQVDLHGGPPLEPNPKYAAAEEAVALETSLDMQMASAACPRCKLLEVQVPISDALLDPDHPHAHQATADFGTAATTAVSKGADAVSISYGFPSDETNNNVAGKALLQPGTAVVASSGDSGYNAPTSSGGVGSLGAPWPQNLPWVTSSGGTSLYAPTATEPDYTETAWNMAGSGCDPSLPPAVGQPDTVNRQCRGHSASSDISAVSDPATGVAVYDTYTPAGLSQPGWLTVGGTSAAAPLIAGMYTRGGHTAAVTGPNTLYGKPAAAFQDITVGQNAPNGTCQQDGFARQVCTAGPGWDGPGGLGSPHGLAPFS